MISQKLKFLYLAAGFMLFFSACELDPIIDEGDPAISVSGIPQGTVPAGTSFTIQVSADPYSATQLLNTLEIREEGSIISFDRLTVNGTPGSANPILLFNDDKSGLDWDITIKAHESEATHSYAVIVKDEDNNDGTFDFDISTDVEEPTVNIITAENILVSPGALIGLPITLTKGTFPLASITVYENDELISDLNRLSWEELGNYFTANPYLLEEEFREGGSSTLYLKVQEDIAENPYRVVVADEEGYSSSFSFNVKTSVPVFEITGVLFNAGGPEGTGGLDLDDGIGTGSLDERAEIKDEGIDLDLPNASNWKRSISGVNGSVVKQLVPGENGLSETFAYEEVTQQEALAVLFENGVDFTLMNDDNEAISNVVNEGDMFIIQNGEKFYLIIIREVNVVATDNSDNYVIDIKQ